MPAEAIAITSAQDAGAKNVPQDKSIDFSKIFEDLKNKFTGDKTHEGVNAIGPSVKETGEDALARIKKMDQSRHKMDPDALGFGTCTIYKDTNIKVCQKGDGANVQLPNKDLRHAPERSENQNSQSNPFARPNHENTNDQCDKRLINKPLDPGFLYPKPMDPSKMKYFLKNRE